MNTYEIEKTTVWSFQDRGNWGTHKGDYRGNWSPHVPKNLILKYTKPNETVLDCFVGSGTTLVECKLLNRNGIGIDINPNAISITNERLDFPCMTDCKQVTYLSNANNLAMLEDNSIDFICTHPPYANIIQYSKDISGDISRLNYNVFLESIISIIEEIYRVLRPNKYCAFMIADIREHGYIIPLGFMTMQCFIDEGFILKDIVIKEQHNCKSTPYWTNKKTDFYLISHEYVFILKK